MLGTSCAPAFLSEKYNDSFVDKVDRAIDEGVEDYEQGITLTDSDKEYLLKAARRVLDNYFSQDPKLSIDDFENIPENISSQSEKLFITLIVKGSVRGCRSAKKSNLLENTIQAMRRTIEDPRFGGPLAEEELPEARIGFSLLLKPIEVKKHKIKEIAKEIEVGMYTFSLEKDGKKAFFKSSVPISHGYSLKYALKRLGKKAGIGEQAYQDPATKIYKYTTIEFIENTIDKSLTNMYRYNRLVYQSEITKEACIDALRLCGNYLANHINEDGLMTYEYDPYRDIIESPVSSSETIRSLAGVWALAAMGNYFNDDEYKAAAKRAIDLFFTRDYVYDEKQDFGYLYVGGYANIATAAFMVLSLIEIDEDGYHAEKKQKLINFILAMEDKDKGFLYPVYLPDKFKNFERKEVYYPGEALTAIMTLYEKTKDSKYLAVAQRVFNYYKELFKKASRRASMVPWMSKAYTKVFMATGDKKYADFVLEMNDYILSYQKDINEEYVDKIGSFFSKGASYSAGVFLEGIAEGYKVAETLNHTRRMRAYRDSAEKGLRFILQCQYTEDNMFTARNQKLTLGGLRTTIYKSSIRIDCVQHAAFAVLRILEEIY